MTAPATLAADDGPATPLTALRAAVQRVHAVRASTFGRACAVALEPPDASDEAAAAAGQAWAVAWHALARRLRDVARYLELALERETGAGRQPSSCASAAERRADGWRLFRLPRTYTRARAHERGGIATPIPALVSTPVAGTPWQRAVTQLDLVDRTLQVLVALALPSRARSAVPDPHPPPRALGGHARGAPAECATARARPRDRHHLRCAPCCTGADCGRCRLGAASPSVARGAGMGGGGPARPRERHGRAPALSTGRAGPDAAASRAESSRGFRCRRRSRRTSCRA